MTRRDRLRRHRAWRYRAVFAPLAAAALAGGVLMPAAGEESDGAHGDTPEAVASGSETYEVTLITGDVVHWQVVGEHASATVDGDEKSFQTIESGDDYYVIPSDVAPLLGQFLDRELFNVARLIEQGYHDASVDGIPVIVTGDTDTPMGTADAAPGFTVDQVLPSIDALAGRIGHDDAEAFGAVLADAAAATGRDFGTASLAGIEKIWLDQQVEASLEDSVPQTGAPDAWDAGFDGTGSTIAILDTGIDETHADIGDKVIATQNFSSSDTVTDRHGHGTHVAATAAGSGDASAGLRTGVAPGAQLVNAKVLGDGGSGAISDIIAGMEWAADQDVDVISMSLGGGFTDGTDPMSQAVNTITEEHDVLFTVSAGNSGPREQSVTAPGLADAALTVGAVDKDSQLASFSSRGPRLGDFAIKPDITAPGVGIVAARAAGSSMGSPVDDNYTSASGTSMAAPHVAGAVAILAAQHPDWDADTLKAALVNSADPHDALTVYEQGGGELNVANAVETSVVTTPSTLNLGYFQYPHDDADPVTRSLTYTNVGSDAVTFDVAVSMVDDNGNPAADGMVTVDPATVSLEPGASAEVDVTVDVSRGAYSLYSGSVVATDADGERVVGTPAGLYKEPEMHELTVEGIAQDGRPAARGSLVDIIDVVDTTSFSETSVGFVDGTATVRVPPGTYSVMSVITTLDDADQFYESQTMMGNPELEITEDTHLTFDAGKANEITVDTPYEVTVEGHAFSYHRAGADVGSYTHSWVGGDWPYYAAATEPVGQGFFAFASKYELSAPGAWFDLVFPEPNAIPEDVAYQVTEDTVATVDTAYHSDVADHEYGRTHANWQPYEFVAFNFLRYVDVPQERVEYVTGGDTRWRQNVYAQTPFTGSVTESTTYYTAGDHLEQSWFASPNTPSLLEGNEYYAASLPVREGDRLTLRVTEWGDSNTGDQVHFGHRDTGVDSTAFRLYQDGELTAEDARAYGNFDVAPGDSRLRMELDVARDAEWWTTSTQTHTAWEFDSATTSAQTPLPLLQIDYDVDLDLSNQTRHPSEANGPFAIGLDVRHPRGVQGPEIEEVNAWISYDDGETWDEKAVRAAGDGTYEFIVDRRDGGGHASIKVEAQDADGSAIEQEVMRAYKLRP